MTLRYNSKTMEWEGVTGGVDIKEVERKQTERMKAKKIHETYKGYEIELIRGKDYQAMALTVKDGKQLCSNIQENAKIALETLRAMIDEEVKNV